MARQILEKGTADLAAFRAGLARGGAAAPGGYLALIGLKPLDPLVLLEKIEHGLPFEALERFQRNVDLSTREMTDLVRISPRTLARRKEEGRLSSEESDRLVRASRIVGRALELFEADATAAMGWMRSPQRALGGAAPLAVAGTDVGAREVEDLIGRLERGIPS